MIPSGSPASAVAAQLWRDMPVAVAQLLDVRHRSAVETLGHIFIRPKVSGQPLKDFAFELFRWLHIPRFDERVINPKEPETFYAGCAAGIEVSVGEHCVRGLEAYPFSVTLAPEGTKQAADYLREHAHVLAWRLSREGFRCFVPKSIAPIMSEKEGMIYDA